MTEQVNETAKTPVEINPWEEEMIADLAKKHNVSDDIVMDIGVTFLLNEMQSARHNHPCFMTALATALTKQDMAQAQTKESAQVIEINEVTDDSGK